MHFLKKRKKLKTNKIYTKKEYEIIAIEQHCKYPWQINNHTTWFFKETEKHKIWSVLPSDSQLHFPDPLVVTPSHFLYKPEMEIL